MQHASSSSERTPLVQPTYIFESSVTRNYQRRLRNFQCSVCVILIVILSIVLLLTVSYHMMDDMDDTDSNATTAGPLNLTVGDQLKPMLQMQWPLKAKPIPTFAAPAPTKEAISSAVLQGKAALEARKQMENSRTPLDKDLPASRAQRAAATSPKVKPLADKAYVAEEATRVLVNG